MKDYICDPISRDIEPINYKVHIVPKLEPVWTFTGELQLTCKATEDCSVITMNSADLNIEHADIDGIECKDIAFDKKLELMTMV